MNASAPEAEHRAYLSLGSNIHPVENLRRAVTLLRQQTRVLNFSACWETESFGTNGPNFLNVAVCVSTPLDPAALKDQVLASIEQTLGRVRTDDKYAPRTIDLDITLYDGRVLDSELWKRNYLALTFAELLPDLPHPESKEPLRVVAQRLSEQSVAIRRPEIELE